jgi:F0F1-type ATP synthase membrane subunit b/b'
MSPTIPEHRERIMSTHRQLFLSAVSSEFQSYRDLLANDLKRPNLDVKVQQDFVTTGGHTLAKLDDYAWGIAESLHQLGVAYARLGDISKARLYLQQAIQKQERLKHHALEETKAEFASLNAS